MLNYKKVFEVLVTETENYLKRSKKETMILGVSGGIDSTVVAAICHEVSKRSGIKLIGWSLPIKNKDDEKQSSELVGKAFCEEFKIHDLSHSYKALLFDSCSRMGLIKDCKGYDSYWIENLENLPGRTPVSNGNLQARVRMCHLYDSAGTRNGIVMSTDNQSEYQLGFTTIHGSVGDYAPMKDLWKTEVYELAEWIAEWYEDSYAKADDYQFDEVAAQKVYAINQSMSLIPTDGLGISNSDLEQIGAKSYNEVDDILIRFIPFETYRKSYEGANEPLQPHDEMAESDCWTQLLRYYGKEVVEKIWNRHLASEFKRKESPVYIPRSLYED